MQLKNKVAIFLYWRCMYRPLMKVMHYFNLHHTTTIYPNGDTMVWCEWCGIRDIIKHNPNDQILDTSTVAVEPIPENQRRIIGTPVKENI
jgi:hypothetical protein